MAINLEQLESDLGLAAGTLAEASSKEEVVNIDLSSKKIFSVEDYNTLTENHKEELRKKQEDSNQIGQEVALKEVANHLKNQFGIELDGTRKEAANILSGIDSLASRSKEPDEQLTEAQKQIEAYKNKLQEKEKTFDLELSSYKEQIQSLENNQLNSKIDTEINSFYESVADKVTIGREDFADLYKARHDIKSEEGIFKPYKNGEPVKNDTYEDVVLSDHLGEFAKSYYQKPKGGRGENEELGTGPRTPSQFEKQYKKQNPNATGPEFNRALHEAITEGKVELG
jgi:predicted  nucleic acid-binding Zn-ribbon protein